MTTPGPELTRRPGQPGRCASAADRHHRRRRHRPHGAPARRTAVSAIPVAGLFDVDAEAARATARAVRRSTRSSARSPTPCGGRRRCSTSPCPAIRSSASSSSCRAAPPVLIQKPMGEDLDAAKRILACCRERRLVAAVNFQLRFSPNDARAARPDRRAARSATLVDIDVRIVDRPAVGPVDVSRAGAAARGPLSLDSLSRRDPLDRRRAVGRVLPERRRIRRSPDLRDTRSSIILDYGDRIRCSLMLNHTHRAGPTHRASLLKVEGLERRRAR